MDELKFVNEYIREKKTMKEIYTYWYFRRPISFVIMGCICLYVVGMVLYFGSIILQNPITLFCMLFVVAIYPIRYFKSISDATKKDNLLNHGEPVRVSTSITDDKIYPGKVDSDRYLDISLVKKVYLTKNYIVAVLKPTRMLLILKKDSFTVGDSNGLVAFFGEKGIKVVGKRAD